MSKYKFFLALRDRPPPTPGHGTTGRAPLGFATAEMNCVIRMRVWKPARFMIGFEYAELGRVVEMPVT